MRSEKEMLDLITKTAEEDPRIRAAYLEGSRVNPNVPADIFRILMWFMWSGKQNPSGRTLPGLIGLESVYTCSTRRTVFISLRMQRIVMGG